MMRARGVMPCTFDRCPIRGSSEFGGIAGFWEPGVFEPFGFGVELSEGAADKDQFSLRWATQTQISRRVLISDKFINRSLIVDDIRRIMKQREIPELFLIAFHEFFIAKPDKIRVQFMEVHRNLDTMAEKFARLTLVSAVPDVLRVKRE